MGTNPKISDGLSASGTFLLTGQEIDNLSQGGTDLTIFTALASGAFSAFLTCLAAAITATAEMVRVGFIVASGFSLLTLFIFFILYRNKFSARRHSTSIILARQNEIPLSVDSVAKIVSNILSTQGEIKSEEESIKIVQMIYDEAREKSSRGLHVEVFEANFESEPPDLNNQLFQRATSIIDDAVKNNWPLDWTIVVGQNNANKAQWIASLQQLENKSCGKYKVKVIDNAPANLNFLAVEQLNKTYLGFGKGLRTSWGGLYRVNGHFTTAVLGLFKIWTK
jgi:hypothetical protein